MRPSAENALATAAIVLAIVMLLPALSAGPLVLDEHAAYWLSAPDGPLSVTERSLRFAAAPPLACWCQSISMKVFGETEFALRLPSMLGYLLAIGVMAIGSRLTLGGIAAALSAIALALHPDVVDEVRIGRTYGLVVLWTTLLVVLTLRWQQQDVRWKHTFVWAITAAAAVWTHILTIPVVGMSAATLLVGDVRETRMLRHETLAAWIASVLLCLPLIPMIERIWEWRHALNYQTGSASLTNVIGPFLCLALPLGIVLSVGLARAIGARTSGADSNASQSQTPLLKSLSCIVVPVALGIVPLVVLAVIGREDLSSLANPRYRVPLAAANACLLGWLVSRPKWTTAGVATLGISLVAAWIAVGRLPTDLVRVGTPQAVVWEAMGHTLERTVREEGLERAPVFVQSGLIEGTLIPAFPDDVEFHGYVSSRMGRFYARTPNPRYSLPMFWGGDNRRMLEFFTRTIRETAANEQSDLFVAVATDTDINRASYEQFRELLRQFGYEGPPLTGQEQWAMLYHFQRRNSPAN
ncbi:MAG: glycosyltransferase family 39 protein [Planctomycetaceae bacterium]|nr:glycosyltransferase family 39 protein [Planctomycetaceae bacterium]